MSERHKTHNGRDMDGHFKVRQADVEDLQTEQTRLGKRLDVLAPSPRARTIYAMTYDSVVR